MMALFSKKWIQSIVAMAQQRPDEYPDWPADDIPVDDDEAEKHAVGYTCSLLERYLAKAMDGDKISAQIACSIIEKALLGQEGYFLTTEAKKALAVAFRQAAGGGSIDKALGLVAKGRGRNKFENIEERAMLALEVERELHERGGAGRHEHESGAFAAVAKRHNGMSTDKVRKIYENRRAIWDRWDLDDEIGGHLHGIYCQTLPTIDDD